MQKLKENEGNNWNDITPAIKYLNIVIPAKAGIQVGTGCRIKSGMTELEYLIARLIVNDNILFFLPIQVFQTIMNVPDYLL